LARSAATTTPRPTSAAVRAPDLDLIRQDQDLSELR
jgi:hypothetical protein